MATNFDSVGDVLELTAPVGGVVSGVGYKIGRIFCVATVTADAATKFNGAVAGVWRLAKVTAEPWTEGMLVYFNTGASQASSISTTTTLIGVACDNIASGTTTGRVRLNGVSV